MKGVHGRPGPGGILVAVLASTAFACGDVDDGFEVVSFPGSAVGAVAELVQTQLERCVERHPGVRVVQRRTPDAADQRHQL